MANRLSSDRLLAFVDHFLLLQDEMSSDWVFAGVMLRADFEFNPHVEGGPWVAIATKINNTTLGPIPEVRGAGGDMVEAVIALRTALEAVIE